MAITSRNRVALSLWYALPAILFLVVFFVMPLLNNATHSVSGPDTLSYYGRLLTDGYYLRITGTTVVLSLGVAVLSLVFGYPIAYFLVNCSKRWESLFLFCLIAPLLTSLIMRTIGWQVIFARKGLLNSALQGAGLIEQPLKLLNTPTAVVIGVVHVLIPFMVLSIASVLRGIDKGLPEAARILGAGRLRTFFTIIVPLSLDGIATGLILVFMLANGSFVSLLLLGGGTVQNLPLLIYQQFTVTRDFEMASAVSNILLFVAILCLFVQLRFIRRKGM